MQHRSLRDILVLVDDSIDDSLGKWHSGPSISCVRTGLALGVGGPYMLRRERGVALAQNTIIRFG